MSSRFIFLVSAPSGAGKTTLCDRLLAEFPDLHRSITCTTRPPRPGEMDGRDYHFLSPAEFEARLARGEFLEQAQVYGHRYGTLRETVAREFRDGFDVLMNIDVQGAASVRRFLADLPAGDPLRVPLVDIFIAPPSVDALRARLEGRGQDAPEVIARRLRQAEEEMARRGEFRHCVVNDRLDEACAHLCRIVREARGGQRQIQNVPR